MRNGLRDLDLLRNMEKFADDSDFQEQWRDVKSIAKSKLAEHIKRKTGILVNHDSLFDIQANASTNTSDSISMCFTF